MSERPLDPGEEERVAEALASFDDAMASGLTPPAPDPSLDEDQRSELHRGAALLWLLEQSWPRGADGDDAEEESTPTSIPEPAGDGAASDREPIRFGRFEIRRTLGRGGFGIVFLAWDPDLRRQVALKVPQPEVLASPKARRRFLREAHAAGGLDHPHIIPIHQAGKIGPVYYIASGYCEGPTLEEWLATQPAGSVPVHDVARLVRTLALAVQHAHERGVLHRDLKPSNILLQQEPAGEAPDGRQRPLSDYIPRLTDFSLARIVGEGGTWSGRGIPFGSPSYMAPEQAEGKSDAIGPATDVYGLGCILYELLTGRAPFRGASQVETLRLVLTAEPVSPRRLRREVPSSLESITLKCLDKHPAGRYSTARELADDLERFLADRPVRARPVPAVVWLLRLAWRHRRTIAIAASLLILTDALTGRLLSYRREVASTRNTALRNAEEARRSARRASRLSYVVDIQQAARAVEEGIPATAMRLLEEYLSAAGVEDQRDFAWYHLDRRCHTERMTLSRHRGAVYHAEFSPDGKMIASAGADGFVRLWDPGSGELIQEIRAHESEVNWVAFSHDGRTLATTSDDGSIRLWDARTGERRRTLKGHDRASTIALFEPGGETLLSCGRDDGKVRCWDLRTGRETFAIAAHQPPLESMAVSPQGDLFATVGGGATFMTWRRSTREPFRELHHLGANLVDGVAFSHDGTRLATAGDNGEVFVWEAYGGPYTILPGHSGGVIALAFSRDGRTLFSAGRDATIRSWEVDTVRTKGVHLGHRARIWGVSLSPDEKTIVSASDDETVKLWDAAGPTDVTTVGVPPSPIEIGFARDGRLLTIGRRDDNSGTLTYSTWRPETGSYRETGRIDLRGALAASRLSRNGRRLALPLYDRRVEVWDLEAAGLRATLGPFPAGLSAISIDPTGRWLLLTCDQDYEVWNLDSSRRMASLERLDYNLVALLPDGHVWFRRHNRSSIFIWAPRTGEGDPIEFAENYVGAIGFDEGCRTLGLGRDQSITYLDASTSSPGEHLVRCDPVSLSDFALSPDGRTVATAHGTGRIELWDVEANQHLMTLRDSGGQIRRIAFSPDGSALAALIHPPGGDARVIAYASSRSESASRVRAGPHPDNTE